MISKTVTDSFPGTEKKIKCEKKVRVQCVTNKSFLAGIRKNCTDYRIFSKYNCFQIMQLYNRNCLEWQGTNVFRS